jgi:hypothetical protein
MKNKVNYICAKCCSNNVLIKTESAFDSYTQQFIDLEPELDRKGYCYNCKEASYIKQSRLLNTHVEEVIQELDISIACLLDSVVDDANIRDIEHIQDFFTRLSNMLVDAEENIYEEISR